MSVQKAKFVISATNPGSVIRVNNNDLRLSLKIKNGVPVTKELTKAQYSYLLLNQSTNLVCVPYKEHDKIMKEKHIQRYEENRAKNSPVINPAVMDSVNVDENFEAALEQDPASKGFNEALEAQGKEEDTPRIDTHYSKDLDYKAAVKMIQEAEMIDSIEIFIEGDNRSTINAAAEKRIEELNG
jgi:hypothetical protein